MALALLMMRVPAFKEVLFNAVTELLMMTAFPPVDDSLKSTLPLSFTRVAFPALAESPNNVLPLLLLVITALLAEELSMKKVVPSLLVMLAFAAVL